MSESEGKFNPESEKSYRIEIVEKLDEKTFSEIFAVEQGAFPEELQLDEEDIRSVLENPKTITVVLKDQTGIVKGFFSGAPNSEFYEEFLEENPEEPGTETDQLFENSDSKLYIFDMAILEESRGKGGYSSMINAMINHAREKGFTALTMHARKSEPVTEMMQKRYGARLVRTVDKWLGGEPFDYLELGIEDKK